EFPGRDARKQPLRRREPESAFEALGVSRPYFRIDDAWRSLAVERVKHLLGGYPAHVLPRFPGHPSRVRACEDIIELQQWMLRRRRLLGPDVETCAGNALLAQGLK